MDDCCRNRCVRCRYAEQNRETPQRRRGMVVDQCGCSVLICAPVLVVLFPNCIDAHENMPQDWISYTRRR